MFTDQVVSQLVARARQETIAPPSLLAVIEVESAGNPFEADGVTPRFLFERHIFYRELYARNRKALSSAVSKGLANRSRQAGQYQDQGTSAGRMRLLNSARAIDEECANRACSWGVGQVLGANAESLGYPSATAMVSMLSGGLIPQVDSMIRFIKKNNLIPALNMHDWAAFALRYNGVAYKTNRYDVKMATAYAKWSKKLDGMVIEPPPSDEEPAPPEPTDDIPPPYIEPKTPAKSKTLWSVLGQIFSTMGIYIGAALSDWRVITAGIVGVVILALFIGRERILKIIEDHQ